MKIFKIFTINQKIKRVLPLYETRLSAGFPSPADDFVDIKLDLNEYLIKHPSATFFVRVSGDSMIGVGIFDGDLLVVDRSLESKNRSIIIASLDGELTVKRLCINHGTWNMKQKNIVLVPEDPKYKPIEVNENSDFSVWGVVVWVVHKA